jgi:4-hydroxy-tetrahydrodipicolinate synthase
VDRVSEIVNVCPLTVLSGDDSLALPMMAVGAQGVVSVASNIVPKPLADMVHMALTGRWDDARRLHLRYYNLFKDLFLDTNPIPVKAAMHMMGMIEETYRLPLCRMSDKLKTKLRETLEELALI